MQAISVYLYPNKFDVYTNSLATWTTERYRRVYNRNLKIYRGVDNKIDLQLRNADEKATTATGVTLVFNLVDRDTQKLILQKDAVTVDAANGRFYVSLTEAELLEVDQTSYQYSIHSEDRTDLGDGTYTVTSRKPIYVDSQYGTLGTAELLNNGQGEVLPSTEVTTFDLKDPAVVGVSNPKYYLSSLIDGHSRSTNPQSLHTFQFMFTGYQGTAMIQGSLDDNASPKNWVDLEVIDVVDTDTSLFVNITGKWNWFRVKQNALKGSNAAFVIQQTNLGNYIVNIDNSGLGYRIGEELVILGSSLGGVDTTNDLTITVTGVDSDGRINTNGFHYTGTSISGYKTFVITGAGPKTTGKIDKVLYR